MSGVAPSRSTLRRFPDSNLLSSRPDPAIRARPLLALPRAVASRLPTSVACPVPVADPWPNAPDVDRISLSALSSAVPLGSALRAFLVKSLSIDIGN